VPDWAIGWGRPGEHRAGWRLHRPGSCGDNRPWTCILQLPGRLLRPGCRAAWRAGGPAVVFIPAPRAVHLNCTRARFHRGNGYWLSAVKISVAAPTASPGSHAGASDRPDDGRELAGRPPHRCRRGLARPSAGGASDASPHDRERGANSTSVATAGADKRVRAERQGQALQGKAASATTVSKRRSW
jgi:hypothetical protein